MRTRTKICGIKSPEIAQHAINCGADAIGLNFYAHSSRYLELDLAAKISAVASPFVAQVGVLVNPTEQEIEQILQKVSLDYLQFHGDEKADYCAQFEIPYIKAIRVKPESDLVNIESQYCGASALLLDSYVSEAYGGTGEAFAWNRAKFGSTIPIILAGGLHAENVQQAIQIAQPYCVDVSSGVETGGEKDPDKISAFCSNVQLFEDKTI